MLKSLDTLGYVNWVTHLRKHLMANGFGYIWISQNVTNEACFLSEYVQIYRYIFYFSPQAESRTYLHTQ